MNCPVCPRTEIPPDVLTCPNCAVDLTPVRRVEELAGSYFNDALQLLEGNDLAGAMRRLEAALALDSANVAAQKLLGGIFWKQGRRQDAVRCWTQAAERDPESEDLQAMLRMAREETRPRVRWILLTAMIGLLLIVVIVSHRLVLNSRRVRNLEDQLAALKLNPPATRGRPADIAAVAKVFESVSGLVVKRVSDSAVLTFSEGLFGAGSGVLTARGQQLLSNAEAAIQRCDKHLRITIEGHTDDRPVSPSGRWSDNWALGLSRSEAAALYLRNHHDLSRVRWQLRSAGDLVTPYPNDSRENRNKNRTVVLYVALELQGSGTEGR